MRLHAWIGVLLLIPLAVVAISGAGLSFAREIDRVLAPELWTLSPPDRVEAVGVERLIALVEAHHPEARLQRLEMPARLQDTAMARLVDARGEPRQIFIDPYRQTVVGERPAHEDPRQWLGEIHASLIAGTPGRWLVILSSAGLLVLFLSGWIGRPPRHGGGVGRSHRGIVTVGAWLWSISALTGLWAVAAGYSLSGREAPHANSGVETLVSSEACVDAAIETVWWREDGRAVLRCRSPGSVGPFGLAYQAGGERSAPGAADWLAAVHTGGLLGVGGNVVWFWGTLMLPVAMALGLIAFRRRSLARPAGRIGRPVKEERSR
nr:PepSY-associated TM helix domain-containing protein [Guyparkeria hydrothermalis]